MDLDNQTQIEVDKGRAWNEVKEDRPQDASQLYSLLIPVFQNVNCATIVARYFDDFPLQEDGDCRQGADNKHHNNAGSGACEGDQLPGAKWVADGNVAFRRHDDDQPGAGYNEVCDETVGQVVKVEDCVADLVM